MLLAIVGYFIFINAIGITIMYSDKNRAKRGKYRISEATLWRVAIIGGATGMTLGMHRFRHKTKRLAFRIGLPTLAVVDVLFLLLVIVNASGALRSGPLG